MCAGSHWIITSITATKDNKPRSDVQLNIICQSDDKKNIIATTSQK